MLVRIRALTGEPSYVCSSISKSVNRNWCDNYLKLCQLCVFVPVWVTARAVLLLDVSRSGMSPNLERIMSVKASIRSCAQVQIQLLHDSVYVSE